LSLGQFYNIPQLWYNIRAKNKHPNAFSDLSLPKSPLLPTNSYYYTAYIMSSYLIEVGPVNLVENMPVIAPSEAYEGSDTLLKSTPF